MTPHRDTIRKQLGITTPSYRDMMHADLKASFMDMRHVCRLTWINPVDRAKALAEMARIRQQIANLDTWSRDYV